MKVLQFEYSFENATCIQNLSRRVMLRTKAVEGPNHAFVQLPNYYVYKCLLYLGLNCKVTIKYQNYYLAHEGSQVDGWSYTIVFQSSATLMPIMLCYTALFVTEEYTLSK